MEDKKKTDSRKFIVWITWTLITILVMAWCTAVMIITKQIADELVSLVEKVLAYFFAVSMMYLGVNVGQKLGFAFADAITKPKEKDTKVDE